MSPRTYLNCDSSCRAAIGVGGIGSGMYFALEGDHSLGRNESRLARLLDVRDYCKLHIVAHHVAVLLGADPSGVPFLVLPVGKVGNDDAGRRLLEEMRRAGMNTSFVEAVDGEPTLLSVCFQYPDGTGGNITTSVSAASALATEEIDWAFEAFPAAGSGAVAIAMPEVPLRFRRHLLEAATRRGALRAAVFTSAEIRSARDDGMLELVDLLAMNEDEAQVLTGAVLDPGAPEPFLDACRDVLARMGNGKRIIVTAGRDGAFALDPDFTDYCPAAPVTVASTAGAGDALLGGVIAGLVGGMPFVEPGAARRQISELPLSSAFDLGCLVAGFSVTSPHTIHPELSLENVLQFAGKLGIPLDPSFLRHVCRSP